MLFSKGSHYSINEAMGAQPIQLKLVLSGEEGEMEHITF